MRFLVLGILSLLLLAACDGEAPPVSPVEQAIHDAFAPYGEQTIAEATDVAWCESRFDPSAANGQYLGLYQIGQYHYWRFGGEPWDDPEVNARAAASLYAEQGWRPWSCRP